MFKRKKNKKVTEKKAIRLIKKVIEPELEAILNENPDMDLLFIDFEKRGEGYLLKNGIRNKKVSGKEQLQRYLPNMEYRFLLQEAIVNQLNLPFLKKYPSKEKCI